jgi:SAM-dependent methyltransferase
MLTIDFDRLELRPGMTVLDAGCGEGRHALELRRRGCRAVAVDWYWADLMRAKYLLASLAIESAALSPSSMAQPASLAPASLALRADARRLPFPDASFDRVICSEVLEHVADPAAVARELARVLKPAGLLAVSVPTPWTEWAFRFASDDYFNTPGGHVRIFTPRRLMRLVSRAGLRVTDLHFEHSFHSAYWWVRGVFGLHNERHPAIRQFRRVLTYTLFSPALRRAERWLNWIVPKSMVFYFEKRPAPSRAA